MDCVEYLRKLDGMSVGERREMKACVHDLVNRGVSDDGRRFNGWRMMEGRRRLLGYGWEGACEETRLILRETDRWIEYPDCVWDMVPPGGKRERRLRYVVFLEDRGIRYASHWDAVVFFSEVLERLGYRIEGAECPLWRSLESRWE